MRSATQDGRAELLCKGVFLAVSCAYLSGCPLGLAQSLADGMKAWRQGDYPAAQAALSRLAPRDGSARLAYAQLLLETGRYAQAAAVARAGNDPRLAVALGEALRRQGKYQEAESALAASPLPAGQLAYADLLMRRNQKAKAKQIYRAISKQAHPDWEGALAAAQSLQRLEDFHGANAAFQDLLDRHPESLEARFAWADLFLEKYNSAEALGLYEEILKKNPHHPRALAGMARCLPDPSDARVRKLLEQALEKNPDLVEVFQMRARQLIEEEQYDAATRELAAAEKIDPENLETWALRGALAYFTRQGYQQHFDRIASVNPGYGQAWFELGELCASHKRFEEAVRFFRQAIELDAQLWRAHAALGINLLRLAEDRDGKEALERAYAGDPFHVWTVNTLRLLDSFKYYRDSQTAHFRVRIHSKEEMLRELAEEMLEKSYRVFADRYAFSPPFKTSVEFYPNHEDFAVRTLGVPGLGALGATFGKVVALDSPSARKRGDYNWASTLWHEVAHVFALSLSDMKVPRWLTEGLSTYEENLARPGWGRRIDPLFIDAANKGQLLPLKELSTGFLRPKFPAQIMVSYTQGALICRYLAEQYGWERFRQLLRLFREQTEAEAFQAVYGKSLEQLDAEFHDYLKPLIAQVASQVDPNAQTEYARQVRQGEMDFKSGDWAKAAAAYRRAIALEPEPRYPVNVFFKLGEAEEQLGNLGAAMEAFLKAGQLFETGDEAYLRAFDLAIRRDHPEIAGEAYENLLYIYPAESDLHLKMGEAWLRWNRPERAIVPLKRAAQLASGDVAQANYLLGRAYWTTGKPDLARRALLVALDIAPSFEKAQQLLLQIAEERK